jgi:hypothetical protein
MYYTVSQLLNNPRRIVYLNDQYMKEIFKFKDHDIQFLKLFWQPDFDESWILLDEPFIETWLIQDTNLNLNQLYQQILFTMFHKDADYKLSFEANPESIYMVKGHCLKDLCIICNKLFRDFFVRLARVAHMLVISKSIDDNTTQIKLNKTTKQLNILSNKTDNLTFLVEEIISERLVEVANRVIPDSRCEEVINLIKLPQPFSASPYMPPHLHNAGYVVIRCLQKNYAKHFNRIKTYGMDGCDVMMEEVFESPISNKGVDIVKALKKAGIKTHKSNGVSTDDHTNLIEMVKLILGVEEDNINL